MPSPVDKLIRGLAIEVRLQIVLSTVVIWNNNYFSRILGSFATMTIGIFPASGGLGTSTYTHLLKLVPNNHTILISRYPEKVPQPYVNAGVQLRQASYESTPAELEAAFAGIDVLFLISYPSHVHEYRTKVGLKHAFFTTAENDV